MRALQPHIVVTFHTTAEAMHMEKLAKARNIEGRLISAPRALSADCGIAWRSPPEQEAALRRAIFETNLEIHGIHVMT